jgi:hypothetical protein
MKSRSSISPSDKFDRVISKQLAYSLSLLYFRQKTNDFSYISMFTLVTGRKLPLRARIFFLYNIAAGSMFRPEDQT